MTAKDFCGVLQDLAMEGEDPKGFWATETRERGKIAVRICAKYTPPNDGNKTSKQAVMSLRKRIAWNIMGPSAAGPMSAKVIRDRRGDVHELERTGKGGLMPFVVARTGSSRDVPITDPMTWLSRSGNTSFTRKKNKAWRWPSSFAHVYVKGAALRGAVRTLQARAGYLISGWAPAARYVGIANLGPYLPEKGAPGMASVSLYGDTWYAEFTNDAPSRFHEAPCRAGRVSALPDVTWSEFIQACAKRERNIRKWMQKKCRQ